jgi:hypothetical protein
MRINKSAVAAASAVTFVGLLGTFGAVALADDMPHARGVHAHTGATQHQTTVNVNGGRHSERRTYSENHDDGDRDYGRHHRRHHGIGFGGISINLGDDDSSCRYSYRKWQATGSRHWRSRYYDCVG